MIRPLIKNLFGTSRKKNFKKSL